MKFNLLTDVALPSGTEALDNVNIIKHQGNVTLSLGNIPLTGPGIGYIVPDYKNMDTTDNKISTKGGTWEVEENGFIYCFMSHDRANVAFFALHIYIDDVIVGKAYRLANIPSSYVRAVIPGCIYPVTKGNVVRYESQAVEDTGVDFQCYFIPPKIITLAPPQPTEVTGHLSLDEKPVMIWLSDGTMTQKQDIDGSPIWERTFQFNVDTSQTSRPILKLIDNSAEYKRIVEAKGSATTSTWEYSLESTALGNFSNGSVNGPCIFIDSNNHLYFQFFETPPVTVNSVYYYTYTIQYTKSVPKA